MTIDQFVGAIKSRPFSVRRAAWEQLQVEVIRDLHGAVAYPDVLLLATAEHLRAALAAVGLLPDLQTQMAEVQAITATSAADLQELAGEALELGSDTTASLSIEVPEWVDSVVVEADSFGVRVEVRWDGDLDGDVDAKYASAFADTYQQAYDSAIAQALAEMSAGAG